VTMFDPRMMHDNMTSAQQFVLFGFVFAGLWACYGDAYYTAKGLAKGFVEANPVARYLQAKIGQVGTAVLGMGLFIAASALFSMWTAGGSIGFAAGITAIETYSTYHNKKNLGLKWYQF